MVFLTKGFYRLTQNFFYFPFVSFCDGLTIVEALFPLGSHFPLTSTEIAIKSRPYMVCFDGDYVHTWGSISHGVPRPLFSDHRWPPSLFIYFCCLTYNYLYTNVKSFYFFRIKGKGEGWVLWYNQSEPISFDFVARILQIADHCAVRIPAKTN